MGPLYMSLLMTELWLQAWLYAGVHAQDINDGAAQSVGDISECEKRCNENPDCNAAAFYESDSNCFLKNMEDACAVPGDAAPRTDAWLLLKCDSGDGCSKDHGVVPEKEETDSAAAPLSLIHI